MSTCGHKTPHGQRIGCCATCGRMFSGDRAFTLHRRVSGCVHPVSVGLVARPSKSHPAETLWGQASPALPAVWGEARDRATGSTPPETPPGAVGVVRDAHQTEGQGVAA